MRKTKRKKHTKTITKIVLFSGILIGGGISAQPVLLDSLKKSIRDIATYHVDIVKGTSYPLPVIDVCKFHNEANLLGALYHFMFE